MELSPEVGSEDAVVPSAGLGLPGTDKMDDLGAWQT